MSITAFGLLLGFAAGAPIPPVIPATARETREEFERLVGQFKVFDLGSFMSASHGTQDIRSLPPSYRADYQRLTLQLTHPRHQTASLIELLRHDDSHVRTLAVGALAAKEDPKVLPHIAALVHDHAPTLPFPRLPSSGWESRIQEQDVARVVRNLLVRYMRTAGVGNAEWDVKWTEEFQRYWSSRKDRTYCAGWFDIQLLRASEVSTHPIDERLPLVSEVRERIDRLPQRDRAMTLLWFRSSGEDGDTLASHLVKTPDLVEILRQLDPADLRGVLARKLPTDDPDLSSRFDRMCLFILKHARELLRPEDADFLLECERQERGRERQNAGLESSSWTTAANELKSRRSPQ